MVGILVHGDNHFIVRGPKPDAEVARMLIRQWSVIQIGAEVPLNLQQWRISTEEFRENLEWAILVRGSGEMSAAVKQLLMGLQERGILVESL